MIDSSKEESCESFISAEDDSTIVAASASPSLNLKSGERGDSSTIRSNISFTPDEPGSSRRNSARLSSFFSKAAERIFKPLRDMRYAKAEKPMVGLELWLFESQTTEKLRVCKVLLHYARSEVPVIQSKAFGEIVNRVVRLPALRNTFGSYCQARGGSIKSVSASWERPSVQYDAEWQYFYHLATLCLEDNPIMDAAAQLDLKYRNSDFACFERLLKCCSDRPETVLALEFMGLFWNGNGIDTYLQQLREEIVLKFTKAIRARFKVASSDRPSLCFSDSNFDWLVRCYMQSMWRFASSGIRSDGDLSLKDESERVGLWSEVYAIHCAVRSETGKRLTPRAFIDSPNDWMILVESRRTLTHPNQADLQEKLMQVCDNRQL